MAQVLAVTTPFFALVLLGWSVVRMRWLPQAGDAGIARPGAVLRLPCMLLRFSATTPITQSLDPSVVTVYLGCAMAMVALAVGAS